MPKILLILLAAAVLVFLIVWAWMRLIVGPDEAIRREIAHGPDSQDDMRLAGVAAKIGSSSSHPSRSSK
jgi:hypothetical protein